MSNKNLLLFTGEETYLLHDQVKQWKEAFIRKHGDINLVLIDADDVSVGEIMTHIEAVPFLGEKRLIFITNLPDAPKTRGGDEPTKKDEKRDEELKKLLASLDYIPDTSVVVFVQSNPDKRRSFYKQLIKKAEVREFKPLSGATLTGWVLERAKKSELKLDAAIAEYLISQVGQNLWRLHQEVEKLAAYAGSTPVTRADIDSLVTPTLEANIFHLTDALGAKNHKKAIQNLHHSMAAGENLRPVFYMIVRQFRLLLQISGYMGTNPTANPTAIASALKLHPFVARNTWQQLKHFKRRELKEAYARLLEIDTALKTSGIRITTEDQDELALAIERFILRFCC